jgi:hypothetical protein
MISLVWWRQIDRTVCSVWSCEEIKKQERQQSRQFSLVPFSSWMPGFPSASAMIAAREWDVPRTCCCQLLRSCAWCGVFVECAVLFQLCMCGLDWSMFVCCALVFTNKQINKCRSWLCVRFECAQQKFLAMTTIVPLSSMLCSAVTENIFRVSAARLTEKVWKKNEIQYFSDAYMFLVEFPHYYWNI